jgi:ABC-type proline/glycine betaine transport system permease subunit
MRGVPESIKEAAVPSAPRDGRLLKDVEIPLALPSIMTGVNQTILMCLSMVVIISLIGGGGLGQEILEALQFAAKGPGLLGGFAILFLAMVIDRIVQGAFRRASVRRSRVRRPVIPASSLSSSQRRPLISGRALNLLSGLNPVAPQRSTRTRAAAWSG